MRFLVDVPDDQIEALAVICTTQGISRSEAVRRAIGLYIEQAKPSVVDVFGLWRTKSESGVSYQKRLRASW